MSLARVVLADDHTIVLDGLRRILETYFDLVGMAGFTRERLEQAQQINLEEWRRELLSQDELFMKLYSDLPKELIFQRELLVARL